MENINLPGEPCEPCEAEEKERAAQQVYAHSYSSNAALDAPSFPEASQENLLLAVRRMSGTLSKELDKLHELEMFLEENDVPDSLIDLLFGQYKYYLQQ